jgi:hypothetical protein
MVLAQLIKTQFSFENYYILVDQISFIKLRNFFGFTLKSHFHLRFINNHNIVTINILA